MNNLTPCLNCPKLRTQLQTYYSLPFTTKAQQYLFQLIHKHQNFAQQQKIYTLPETQEQEFLNQVATTLIGGLLGTTKYSQLKGTLY
ncbi:MAG: hypothetical protein MRECE_12c025 [Mycoplasmataceae bacterium CE_OT135]|nr:MAG: hypothetical protein MRECE_12c025 [Mycoplasmataceae bacterium CE_OT135]